MDEPEDKPKPTRNMSEYVKAESMIQLAIIMPAACVIGWFGGSLLDRWLHTNWIYVAGIVVGAVAGFVHIYRVAAGYMRKSG
ncbi:MAG: AtpZ/AtpI family protein [Acidobacteriaceae bacterium]|jgi:F0F1-type ATP synthase assembly protein I|nr:AtpZ/AtpI family protein [Acidobacteriaceae bacterium]